MSNSTPYELRFKVLEMARDLCMDEYNQRSNAFWQLHNKIEDILEKVGMNELTASKLKELSDELKASIPTMPDTDTINGKAKELYEFVSTK